MVQSFQIDEGPSEAMEGRERDAEALNLDPSMQRMIDVVLFRVVP